MASSSVLSAPKPFSSPCNLNPNIDLRRPHIISAGHSRHTPVPRFPSPNSLTLPALPLSKPRRPSIRHGHGRTFRCSAQSRPDYIPNRIDDPNYVRIFDITLRDGEQSPGATMTSSEKLAIARQLARLGVDIIEAGFPASSPGDFDAVRSIAIEVGNQPVGEDGHVPVICGLARCNKNDISAAWEAVRQARRPRVHTFIATSEIHMKHKLGKTREVVVAIARDMVAFTRRLGCEDIEFSPEDAGRSAENFCTMCWPKSLMQEQTL